MLDRHRNEGCHAADQDGERSLSAGLGAGQPTRRGNIQQTYVLSRDSPHVQEEKRYDSAAALANPCGAVLECRDCAILIVDTIAASATVIALSS